MPAQRILPEAGALLPSAWPLDNTPAIIKSGAFASLELNNNGFYGDAIVSVAGAGSGVQVIAPNPTGKIVLAAGFGAEILLDGATSGVYVGKVGSSIGEFGAFPTPQSPAIPDAAGGLVVDVEARDAINDLLAYFRLRGTIAP
jgi:hypothetical protein